MSHFARSRYPLGWGLTTLGLLLTAPLRPAPAQPPRSEGTQEQQRESEFLSSIRQLTFEGRRAGEGYFGAGGRELVFQSERLQGNPFFQIFVMDLETGDTAQISPGMGKTTCAWLHPRERKVLFASTHEDPEAQAKQLQELEDRAAGKERRYTWDYDPQYELYEYDRDAREMTRLTHATGYDAEGSWSPDGEWIAFASTRHAYEGALTDEQRETLERDPSFFAEIYLMRRDGSQLRRLTQADGYDGGPFFSPDGSRICWRRFSPDGALAEIMTMRTDGSDARQLTRLGAMSWAPFYHPSGEYIIFTTNKHGFGNFELYVVDVQAQAPPLRVTHTDGFDGLPAFSPDGERVTWTSNRTANKQSQIFLADWNHQRVRERLAAGRQATDATTDAGALPSAAADVSPQRLAPDAAQHAAREAASSSQGGFLAQDILRHVGFLCLPELEGRLTGTQGEILATAYVAAYLDSLGLEPAGDDGGWFQAFDFTSGISLGDANRLADNDHEIPVGSAWRPLSFSATGEFGPADVVFAGYGISAPAEEGGGQDRAEYDAFTHLDLQGKWVLCFRFMPESITAERRQHLARYSSLRFKAMKARDLGALGLLIVSGPTSRVNEQLVPLKFDGALAGSSLPVISVADEVAAAWMARAGKDLETVQQAWDTGQPTLGFTIPNLQISARIELQVEKKQGRNVLGRLPATVAADEPVQTLIVGAHIDHLGRGTGGSLARDDESDQIHFGADDNASGVAAMLEIAEYLAGQRAQSRLNSRRDIVFAAWSGEELGLLGSSHFVASLLAGGEQEPADSPADAATVQPQGSSPGPGREAPAAPSLHPRIAACLNLDMVGRLDRRLVLQGVGSSSQWLSEIEQRNAPLGLPIVTQEDSYLPTDSSSFFVRGVPVLSAFTGTHPEYHTPRDTPDRLNYEGAARVAHLMALMTRALAQSEAPPDFVPQARAQQQRPRAGLRAYLGTIPDYGQSDQPGVLLSGVAPEGPAARAGVEGGDVIVELAGKKIENIYDYTYAIEALKIGQSVRIAVQRDGQRLTFDVTPASRD